jgi:hypothetical protein
VEEAAQSVFERVNIKREEARILEEAAKIALRPDKVKEEVSQVVTERGGEAKDTGAKINPTPAQVGRYGGTGCDGQVTRVETGLDQSPTPF